MYKRQGLIGAAAIASDNDLRAQVEGILRSAGARLEEAPSLRFILTWETDANDVDFHIRDRHGNHAYYRQKQLSSGGELYADLTRGYGPECFTIPNPRRANGPYRLSAHYYRMGPMGFGGGKVEVISHDGRGGLSFAHRPFVIMSDGATVELGEVKP